MSTYRHAKIALQARANAGDAQSQYDLACLYKNGCKNAAPNYLAAVRWLELAVKQGHIDAMRSLAKMYSCGLGVNVDINKAEKLSDEVTRRMKSVRNQLVQSGPQMRRATKAS